MLDKFVPVVDNPGNYVKADTSRLQYQLVERILEQSPYGQVRGAQGLYVVTPSGMLIAGTTRHSDPSAVLAEMRKGLKAYDELPRKDRLLPRAPDTRTDRVEGTRDSGTPPEGGLVLRVVTRGLDGKTVGRDDTRHPDFYKLDRVWLTREQARSLLPSRLQKGERSTIRGEAATLILRLHLGVFVQPNPAWNQEDIQRSELTAEVVAVKGDRVEVRFAGEVEYEASSQWNNRTYSPRLLGRATWDSRKDRFEALELVAVGTHTLGDRGEDERARGAKSIPLGVLFTLNGTNSNDAVPPEYYQQYDWALRSAR